MPLDAKLQTLNELVEMSGDRVEGNVGESKGFRKGENFLRLVEELDPQSYLETGFNAGHSSTIVRHAARSLDWIAIFDLNYHFYTHWCAQMFSAMDDGRTHSVQFLEGDSRLALSDFANAEIQRESAFDLIHIDGIFFEKTFALRNEDGSRLFLAQVGMDGNPLCLT